MVRKSRPHTGTRPKPAKARKRRRAAGPPVPPPYPIGWRGSGPGREPDMAAPEPRSPTQDEEREGEPVMTRRDSMYKRVLVPLDGSPVAETIVPFILGIAGPLDMEVVLLRVVEPIQPVVIEGSRHIEVEDVEVRRTDAEKYLAPLAVELRNEGVKVESRVRRGNAVDQIVAAARETGADLIAMSTHGRGGLGRLVFGSVAQAVLRQAEVPVFLMRATESQVTGRAAREAVK